MNYELGDTLVGKNGEKVIVYMTFFVTNSLYKDPKKKDLAGFWGTDDKLKTVNPYYLENVSNISFDDKKEYQMCNIVGRGRCLLLEKDLNILLQKDTAKKFSSILLTHL